MPKQPAKTNPRQSAKYREQQLRRRMAAQARDGETLDYSGESEVASAAPSNGVASMTYTPTAAATGTSVARRPAATAAAPRRAAPAVAPISAARAARGRLAAQVQALDLEDEMAYVRSDVRRLLILAGVAVLFLIVMAFILH